jgi:hypothetical protein
MKRFEEIESKFWKLRVDLNEQSALVPGLATKDDIRNLKTDIDKIRADIATKERNREHYTWLIGGLIIFWVWCYVVTKLTQ